MNLNITRKQMAVDAAIGKLASQVAHDVRSPLAALSVVEKDLNQLPEGARILVRSAISRIQDIAHSLISSKHQRNLSARIESKLVVEPCLLASIIESITSEKRIEYRSRIGLQIISELERETYGSFAEIEVVAMRSILSNLINNAVEAIENDGKVRVCLLRIEGKICIVVSDTGKGIPANILPSLGTRGTSYGKELGLGLGLAHAKECCARWNGSLEISSIQGSGTLVTISLPMIAPPLWFTPLIEITENSNIVILDDDTSIHHIWSSRVEGVNSSFKGNVYHLSSTSQLRQFVVSTAAETNSVFLLDYELVGSDQDGLDIAEELNITTSSFLVTSRYEDKDIISRLEKLEMKMIPKFQAGFVPLKFLRSRST